MLVMLPPVRTRWLAAASRAVSGALFCLTVAQIGCGGSPAAPPDGERFPFIAFAKDFAGFRAWPSHSIESAPAAGMGLTHVAGARTVYINQLPPPGATEFPIGTRIVKVMAADGKIFARCKRGGGFNTTGAVDWEWFELEENASGDLSIRWHGFGPPAGEKYGGDAKGGCNGCHAGAKANDYVLTSWMLLGATGAGGADGAGGAGGAGGATDPSGAGGAGGAGEAAGGAGGGAADVGGVGGAGASSSGAGGAAGSLGAS